MKYLIAVIVALVVAVVVADEEWKPVVGGLKHSEIRERCGEESGIKKEQLESAIKGTFPDEKEMHEYALCYVKSVGIFTDEQGFITDRVLAQLTAMDLDKNEKVPASVPKCVEESNKYEGSAEKAWRGVWCVVNAASPQKSE